LYGPRIPSCITFSFLSVFNLCVRINGKLKSYLLLTAGNTVVKNAQGISGAGESYVTLFQFKLCSLLFQRPTNADVCFNSRSSFPLTLVSL
jgi:hypothetical protein